MIADRAEMALVSLLMPPPHEGRKEAPLVCELLVSAADIGPDGEARMRTVRIHRVACPAHYAAVATVLKDLTDLKFHHPETGGCPSSGTVPSREVRNGG